MLTELGKILIVFGALMLLFGILLVLGGRAHIPIGRLPGDIIYKGKNTTFYFPIVTCLVLSIVISVVFYLLSKIGK